MSLRFLALVYDEQILNDLIDSQLNLQDIILYVPSSLADIGILEQLGFNKVVPIDNYLPQETPPDPLEIDHWDSYHFDDVVALAIEEFKQNPFGGVIAPHEVDLLRAAWLRDLWHLPGQSYKSAFAFRCKTEMKEILKQNGIVVPSFKAIKSLKDIIDFTKAHSFPFVIKPNFGTGSQGITIIQNQAEMEHYLINKWPLQKSSDLEIETFIKGTMYQINGFYKNEAEGYFWPAIYPQQSICMTEGRFASSYILSAANPLIPRLNAYAQRVLTILPTPSNTAFHLELFLTPDNEIVFCEIASRVGGKGVRGSWKECFHVSLGGLFIRGQINVSRNQLSALPFEDMNKKNPLYQRNLSGEIWFPVHEGKLKHIENQCPFPWVKEYHVFYKSGDIFSEQSQNINDCLCGVSLLTAETEEEMQQRLDKIAQWVYHTTEWAPL